MSLTARSDARGAPASSGLLSPANALFAGLFASQAGILVLSPILVDVARDFGVSTAVAGQLRLVAAPVAALAALAVTRFGALPLRTLLLAGAALVAAGSLASAAAPSFALLALAQVPLWSGAAVLLAAGVAASAAWAGAEDRGRTIARALAGPPAAWIVGMPLVGLAASSHWRLAFLVLPLPAAIFAFAAFATRPGVAEQRPRVSVAVLLRRPGARGWALGELLANAAWAGTLVFAGALFVERHGASPQLAGVLLATIAVAYLAGNQFAQRFHGGDARRALVRWDLTAAAAVASTWAFAPSLAVTVALFSAAAYAAAARLVWATSYGFVVGEERRLEIGAVRAVATQLGYLIGALLGGAALAVGGYAAMGGVFATLLVGAALPHLCLTRRRCARGGRLALRGASPAG